VKGEAAMIVGRHRLKVGLDCGSTRLAQPIKRVAEVFLFFVLVSLAGCLTLVADYDEEQAKRSQNVLLKTLSLYDKALDLPNENRRYEDFADRFGEIETQLRVLNNFAQTRANNEDSQKIVAIALKEWIRQRADWKDGSVPISQLIDQHRRNMERMMGAAIQAEEWKKLGSSE